MAVQNRGLTPTASNGSTSAKTITGGRTLLQVGGVTMGIFDSVTINEGLGLEDIHTLGKFGPQEIVMTSYNAVTVNCSGFRVYGSGVKALGLFPTLAELLLLGTVTLSVQDRQNPTGQPLATIINCVPETNNQNYNARATSKINITYRGTMMTDESTPGDNETAPASYP